MEVGVYQDICGGGKGTERGKLQEDLDESKRKQDNSWIVEGNFNIVLQKQKQLGEHFSKICANKFWET